MDWDLILVHAEDLSLPWISARDGLRTSYIPAS
jgi:hypothetical protein